ncbi:hypothetical protein KIH74_21290 [Kineosporia sp. J2-2]|uniref:Uncharacterized protein n=1 Tax=Kineosporia corallincola TaxID=2835133 RepID=A0ABS5TK78_9ACTN|nr:hypothetical protein [Kineosporia corallincola]MBT0771486.1 hypothetical protein [Kineosporia corallincola]
MRADPPPAAGQAGRTVKVELSQHNLAFLLKRQEQENISVTNSISDALALLQILDDTKKEGGRLVALSADDEFIGQVDTQTP